MRPRVKMGWRTRLLLLAAFVVAGVIAWTRVETEMARRQEEARERAEEEVTPSSSRRPPGDVVEIEVVSPE